MNIEQLPAILLLVTFCLFLGLKRRGECILRWFTHGFDLFSRTVIPRIKRGERAS